MNKIIIPTTTERRAFPNVTQFYITLQMLEDAGACFAALEAFEEVFGSDKDHKVFLTLKNAKRLEEKYNGALEWLGIQLIEKCPNHWDDSFDQLWNLTDKYHFANRRGWCARTTREQYQNLIAVILATT